MKIIGTHKSQFSVVAGQAPFTIPPDGTRTVEFRFSPTEVGNKTAEIEIFSSFEKMIKQIIGEGVLPQLDVVTKVIDFKKVKVATVKDTIVAIVVSNIGTSVLSITDSKISGPDYDQFEILDGGGNFTLDPNSSHTMQLRFKPTKRGKTSSSITFNAGGDTDGQKVQLLGEGIDDNPQIYAFNPYFGTLYCAETDTVAVEIINNCNMTLIINEAKITGTNADEFEFAGNFEPISIEPEKSDSLIVVFRPTGTGPKTADLNLFSNDPLSPDFKVTLVANAEQIKLIPDQLTIDLGILCPGETKDTTIAVSNLGNRTSGGFVLANTDIGTDINEFIISSGGKQNININFLGHDLEEEYSTWIRIVDSTCLNQLEIEILAQIIKPDFSINYSNITAEYGSSSKAFINIVNISERDVTVSKIEFTGTDFELISATCPIEIPALGSVEAIVQFAPS
jgi:hypothetical protein